jgi:hypothetical protein
MLKRIVGLGLWAGLMLGVVVESARAAELPHQLPVVESAVLGTGKSIPWSKPVRVEDPFEGSFVGVFDRNYFYDRLSNHSARIEVQSLWSRESVRFLLVARNQDCLGGWPYGVPVGLACSDDNAARAVAELFVRVNEQVYQLSGQNSTFSISSDLAQALQSAPEGNVSIRLVTEGGETVDSEIGESTVAAWKAIYTN